MPLATARRNPFTDYQSCAKGALDESALTKATCLALEKGTPTEQVTETLPITAQFKQDCQQPDKRIFLESIT